LQVWDTAGAERFRTITGNYYRKAHAIIIVYDVTDRKSFVNIAHWLAEVERYCGNDIVRVLVGNKSDCTSDREVAYEEGQTTADARSMLFMETSAKRAINVEKLFNEIGQRLVCKVNVEDRSLTRNSYLGLRKSSSNRTVTLKAKEKEVDGCCKV
jgi:small GTP-binding protein